MCPAAIRAVPAINGGRAESSATHPVIARSTPRALASRREATRQSVLPYPKGRIPTPVTRSLARNDSAALPRCRDVGDAVPYGRVTVILRRAGPMCPAAIRAVPAINGGRAESSATHPVIARSTPRALASRREATRQSVLPYPKGRIPTPVTRSLARNDSAALPRCRDVGDAVPYGRVTVILRRAGPMCPAAIRAVPAINGGRAESSATHPVIARSTPRALASRREATRQSVLPYPKERIPTPVTRHWLGMTARRCRADGTSGTPSPTGGSPSSSVGRDPCVPPRFARCLRRGDVGIAPYGIARVSCNVGRRGRRPLRNGKGRRDALCAHYKTSGCFCWTWTAPSIWMTGCSTA